MSQSINESEDTVQGQSEESEDLHYFAFDEARERDQKSHQITWLSVEPITLWLALSIIQTR